MGRVRVKSQRAPGEWRRFLKEVCAYAQTDDCIEGGGRARPWIRLTPGLKGMRASRYVWAVANGDPGTLFVLHTCDNNLCVNIRHLYLGNQSRNMLDKFERGRQGTPNYARGGDRSASAKLSPEDIPVIRRRHQAGEFQARIAADYAVSQVAISLIIRRRTWTHVP